MPDYIVQEEDGTSRIDQEENTDSVELETSTDDTPPFANVTLTA